MVCLKLSEIGEREIIRRISSQYGPNVLEDSAVIGFEDMDILVSTDSASFRNNLPREASPELIGKFLASINLSDIAAMAGIPLGMVVNLLAPPDTEYEFIESVYKGIRDRLMEFGCGIIGGDTKESGELILSGTIIGKQESKFTVRRKGIAGGQIIGVTGSLGRGAAGYIFYRHGYRKSYGMKLMLDFIPRVREAQILAREGVRYLTDLSDGLYSSLWQIKNASGLGAKIVAEDLPLFSGLNKAEEISGVDPIEMACNYGGDYELMFTIDNQKYGKFKAAMKKQNIPVSFIGEIYEGDIIIYNDEKWSTVSERGFEHFRNMPFSTVQEIR